jgi:hypothetical protein
MAKNKIPVTMRALIQRINRKLAADDERIVAARNERVRTDFGEWYVVDTRTHRGANSTHVDPEALARELGVLKPWEQVR